ncbi:hypothetical protein IKF15_03880 [Candidatus Saccharibacteria bacterium]|nr:hypothetical protein [Candidatus Saccharibacteria bacterium]
MQLNTYQSRIKKLTITIAIVSAFACLIIYLLSLSTHKTTSNSRLQINNAKQYATTLHDATLIDIETILYDAASLNSSFLQKIPTTGAVVRDNSYSEKKHTASNDVVVTFLIDIEPLGQTYRATYRSTANDPTSHHFVRIQCPTKNEIIYKEFVCTELDDDRFTSPTSYPISIRGFQYLVSQHNLSETTATSVSNTISTFIKNAYPATTQIHLTNYIFSQETSTHTFDLSTDTQKLFYATLKTSDEYSYQLTIVDNLRKNIFQVDTSIYDRIYKNPASLATRHLPYQDKLEDGTVFTVKQKAESYEISTTSCGNQSIKDNVLKATHVWLESINYRPTDFEFIIPDHCDAEAH